MLLTQGSAVLWLHSCSTLMEASGCYSFERRLDLSIKVADLWSLVQTAGMHINVTFPALASEGEGKENK